MSFFEINGHPLHVIQSGKIKMNPQMNLKATPLRANSQEKAYQYIYSAGYAGKKFTISVLVKDSDVIGEVSTRAYLNEIIQHKSPVTVVTDALDVPNGKYIIMDSSSEQEFHDHTVWSLDFLQNFNISNHETTDELNKDTTDNTTNAGVLSRCLPLKPGDSGQCVEVLQHTLKNAGYYLYHEGKPLQITGVYDENTIFAVSLLQRDHKLDFNLTVNGLFDYATKECLLYLAG